MKTKLLLLATLVACCAPMMGMALDTKPLKASYDITPADFYDPPEGAVEDTVLIYIDGDAAKDIYEQMGTLETDGIWGTDIKGKDAGGLSCTLAHENEYHCSVGINLKTGATTYASIC